MKKLLTLSLLLLFSVDTFAKNELYFECSNWKQFRDGEFIPRGWKTDEIYIDLDNLVGTFTWGTQSDPYRTFKVMVTMTPNEMILKGLASWNSSPITINRETLRLVKNSGSAHGECKIIEKKNKF